MSVAIADGEVVQRVAFWHEGQVSAVAVPDGSTKLTLGLVLPTGHAQRVDALVSSTQNITVFKRYYGASGQIAVDDAGEAVLAGVPKRLALGELTVSIGQEVEFFASNASGTAASVTIWARAI
jgi:hypothetical protein